MTTRRHPGLALTYRLILGTASGFAVGTLAWMIAGSDRLFWPYAAVGIVLMTAAVQTLAIRRVGRRWIHLLWLPVILLAALMTMVVLALRNFT